MFSITDLVNRFSSIGATFVRLDNETITEPTSGIVVGNGRSSFVVPLDDQLIDHLVKAFNKVLALLDVAYLHDMLLDDGKIASDDQQYESISDPCYGLWLDYEHSPASYLFESGRIFSESDIDNAIDYAIKHDQRFIYDLGLQHSIEITQEVIANMGDNLSYDDLLGHV